MLLRLLGVVAAPLVLLGMVAAPLVLLRLIVAAPLIVLRVGVSWLLNHGSHVSSNDAAGENRVAPSYVEGEGASNDGVFSFELQHEGLHSVEDDKAIIVSFRKSDSASRRVLEWVGVPILIGLGKRVELGTSHFRGAFTLITKSKSSLRVDGHIDAEPTSEFLSSDVDRVVRELRKLKPFADCVARLCRGGDVCDPWRCVLLRWRVPPFGLFCGGGSPLAMVVGGGTPGVVGRPRGGLASPWLVAVLGMLVGWLSPLRCTAPLWRVRLVMALLVRLLVRLLVL